MGLLATLTRHSGTRITRVVRGGGHAQPEGILRTYSPPGSWGARKPGVLRRAGIGYPFGVAWGKGARGFEGKG